MSSLSEMIVEIQIDVSYRLSFTRILLCLSFQVIKDKGHLSGVRMMVLDLLITLFTDTLSVKL